MGDGDSAGPPRFRPYQKPDSAGQTVADIERQEKIERLRAQKADDELFGPDADAAYDATGPVGPDGQQKPVKPKKKHRFLRFLGWMLLIVLLTGGGAAAGWFLLLRDDVQKSKSANGQSTAPPPAPTPPAEADAPTETHNSAPFLLQFDYPQGWKVADNPDNTITAVSPAMKLKVASAGVSPATQTGQVVMTVRHKQISLPEFKAGNAEAIIESEKINYAKPSQAQRASTYVSFLSYADSAVKGIDGIYVTGDNGYQKGQAIPLADVSKSDPLITISFRKCDDEKCTRPGAAVTLAATEWQNTTFSKPLKTMLQSIVAE